MNGSPAARCSRRVKSIADVLASIAQATSVFSPPVPASLRLDLNRNKHPHTRRYRRAIASPHRCDHDHLTVDTYPPGATRLPALALSSVPTLLLACKRNCFPSVYLCSKTPPLGKPGVGIEEKHRVSPRPSSSSSNSNAAVKLAVLRSALCNSVQRFCRPTSCCLRQDGNCSWKLVPTNIRPNQVKLKPQTDGSRPPRLPYFFYSLPVQSSPPATGLSSHSTLPLYNLR